MKFDELSKRLIEIRDERKRLSAEERALKAEADELSLMALDMLEALGSESTKTVWATLTVSRQTVPQVNDWDAFNKWAVENDALFLYIHKLNAAAWRDQLAESGEIPGTEPFEKVSLSLRTA